MEYVFFPSNHYTSHLIGELFIIYLDLLSFSILENCNILDLLMCIALCMTGRSRTSRLWSYDHVFYSIPNILYKKWCAKHVRNLFQPQYF